MSQGKVVELKTVFDEDDANELLKADWDLFSVTYRGTGAALGLTLVKRAQTTATPHATTAAQPRAATPQRSAAPAQHRTTGDQPVRATRSQTPS